MAQSKMAANFKKNVRRRMKVAPKSMGAATKKFAFGKKGFGSGKAPPFGSAS